MKETVKASAIKINMGVGFEHIYRGYVTVKADGKKVWSQAILINRLNRADAINDAQVFIDEHMTA